MAASQDSGGGCGLMALAFAVLIAAGAYLYQQEGGSIFSGRDPVLQPKQEKYYVPLSETFAYETESHILSPNDYFLRVNIFHRSELPVSGRYMVQISGDVTGRDRQDTPEGKNYWLKDVQNAPPGETHGIQVRVRLDNNVIRKGPLDREPGERTIVRFNVRFVPDASETQRVVTDWNFEIRNGKYVDLDEEKEAKATETKAS